MDNEKSLVQEPMDLCEDLANKENEPVSADDVAKADLKEMADEAHAVYGAYSMEDIDNYIAKLDTLTHIECASMLKEVRNHKTSMESLKQLYDGLKGIESTDESSIGTDLALQNAEDALHEQNPEDDFSLKKFGEEFDSNMAALNRLEEALEAKVKEGESKYSSKFYNDEMIQMIEKRIRLLREDDPNYEYHLKRYNVVLNAVRNRLDHNYLLKRFIGFSQNKKIRRELVTAIQVKNWDVKSLKGFRRLINEETLTNVQYYFINLFGVYAKIMMVALNRVLLSEEKTGKDTWAKQLVLNASDIVLEMFDLTDVDEYNKMLQDQFIPVLLAICPYDEMNKIHKVPVLGQSIEPWQKYIHFAKNPKSSSDDGTSLN